MGKAVMKNEELLEEENKKLRDIISRAKKWLERPYGKYFDGGESTDWLALGYILEGKNVVFIKDNKNPRWSVIRDDE